MAISRDELPTLSFSGCLSEDIALMKEILGEDQTVIFRPFENLHDSSIRGCVIFTELLVNNIVIDQNVVRPLLEFSSVIKQRGKPLAEELAKCVICTDEVKTGKNPYDAITSIFIGDTVILLDSCPEAIVANSKKYSIRSVGVPETEDSVNGPKEAFTELIVTNLSLLRRKVKDANLKFRFFEVGKISRTRVCLSYIDDIAEESLIKTIEERLSTFEIDSVLDVSYISELISDNPTSPVDTMGVTERPDVVAARLFEGRCAIFVDGTPFALTAPYLFLENFQANEDYYENFWFGSFLRLLRFFSFFIAVSLPGIYVALISYHKEMIPRALLISIAKSRAAVPFPAALEMFILLLMFDLLRESGVRLPKAIGVTVSTVGAIVLGQSIVSANIVSAEMIIIVAICGIASFLTPKLEGEIIFLRLLLLLLSSMLGIYGYAIGVVMFSAYISSLTSFGVDFTAYTIPRTKAGGKDSFIRVIRSSLTTRPYAIQKKNKTRFRRKYGGR
ncbi:MAG: spore germination protein [Oscillospiraceae bacterium]|nr:spore germination protein [Oscillospiraceae bacterium]